MKKGEIRQGVITSYSFPNKGSFVEDDIKVTVKNALPGQKVTFQVIKKKHGMAVGRLVSVDERADYESEEPFCANFGECGSCLYQCCSYDAQLKIKEKQVLSLIDSVCGDYTYDGAVANPVKYGYRNKMEYTFGDEYKDGPLTIGLHKRGSFYDLVDASCCGLVDEDFGKILAVFKEYCTENELPFYHRVTHQGFLRHLLVRRSSYNGEILVDIVTTDTYEHDFIPLCDRLLCLKLNGRIAGILNTINNNIADTITDEGTSVLYGQDHIYEELLGLRFKITPFSFFQTNSKGAEALYDTVREFLGETLNDNNDVDHDCADHRGKPADHTFNAAKKKIIYDLYSGTGTIAQILAPMAEKVIGVEIVKEAVEAARENAELNNIDNCEFIAGDVLKTLDQIDTLPDVIILDPPRDGVNPKALEKILDYGVEEIVYISCKPTSLARDLVIIQKHGYNVDKVKTVDMFSWTVHVETVVLMSKAEGK